MFLKPSIKMGLAHKQIFIKFKHIEGPILTNVVWNVIKNKVHAHFPSVEVKRQCNTAFYIYILLIVFIKASIFQKIKGIVISQLIAPLKYLPSLKVLNGSAQ